MKEYKVPTGHICTMEGEKGKQLEFLSIGDYGKEKNLKADFMGLSKEINGVPHGDLLPLSEKWVITISSQYGCSMGCKFCDVPKVGQGINATFWDIVNQVKNAITLHPDIKHTKRLNLHYARMGEPTFNENVIKSAYYLSGWLKEKGWGFHPVISTMMPRDNRYLTGYLKRWMNYKNEIMKGNAGLQISINATGQNDRKKMFNNNAMEIEEIGRTIEGLPFPVGRKIALNIALTDRDVDPAIMKHNFNPAKCMIKITPIHITTSTKLNGYETLDGYNHYQPYKKIEEELKAVGFDVIVFIPSKEEDESRITCGNAILSDEEQS